MKKAKTVLAALLAAMIAVLGILCFAACGKEGTYKFSSLSMKNVLTGEVQEYKAGDEFEIPLVGTKVKLEKDYFTVELKKDGTVNVNSKSSESDGVQTGTWKVNEQDSGKVDISAGVLTFTAECNGSKLVFEISGLTYTLKK